MTRLGQISVGGAMAILLIPLTLTGPAFAHTADQDNDTMLTLAGISAVDQARAGYGLPSHIIAPEAGLLWQHLYHGTPDFVQRGTMDPANTPKMNADIR